MATAYTDGLVYLCDSLSNSDDDLPSTIEIQQAVIYRDAIKDKELAVTSLLVQQQKKIRLWAFCDCLHVSYGSG